MAGQGTQVEAGDVRPPLAQNRAAEITKDRCGGDRRGRRGCGGESLGGRQGVGWRHANRACQPGHARGAEFFDQAFTLRGDAQGGPP